MDHIPFNRFIDDCIIFDLPLRGRKFTWYIDGPTSGIIRSLPARYGVERGRLRERWRCESSWWREIASIRDGKGDLWG
ncbi:hypothetical protein A2U01_0065820, partial [Trifolium medium]|nr:hypothetical protein [Trifolium medium]